MHFSLAGLPLGQMGGLLLAVVASTLRAPLGALVRAKAGHVAAQANHMDALAASIRNPAEHALAVAGAELAPVALVAAEHSLQASRDHIVAVVGRQNGALGDLVAGVIDSALGHYFQGLPSCSVVPADGVGRMNARIPMSEVEFRDGKPFHKGRRVYMIEERSPGNRAGRKRAAREAARAEKERGQ